MVFSQPIVESGFDIVNRCVVFRDVASDGASIDRIQRDANARRWLVGPAPARLATEATRVARLAKARGQLGEIVDSDERVRSTGGAGQGTRAEGLDASTRRIESLQPRERRDAFARRMARYRANVNRFCPGRDIGEGQEC